MRKQNYQEAKKQISTERRTPFAISGEMALNQHSPSHQFQDFLPTSNKQQAPEQEGKIKNSLKLLKSKMSMKKQEGNEIEEMFSNFQENMRTEKTKENERQKTTFENAKKQENYRKVFVPKLEDIDFESDKINKDLLDLKNKLNTIEQQAKKGKPPIDKKPEFKAKPHPPIGSNQQKYKFEEHEFQKPIKNNENNKFTQKAKPFGGKNSNTIHSEINDIDALQAQFNDDIDFTQNQKNKNQKFTPKIQEETNIFEGQQMGTFKGKNEPRKLQNRQAPIKAKKQEEADLPIKSQKNKAEIPSEYEEAGELVECPEGCGRKFNEKALEKHRKNCQNVFQNKRNVFNSAGQRQLGKEEGVFEAIQKKPMINKNKPKKGGKIKWKKESESFRAAIKLAKGETITTEQQQLLDQPDESLIQCQFCGRRFNEHAAKKHIPFCETKHKNEAMKMQPKRKGKR